MSKVTINTLLSDDEDEIRLAHFIHQQVTHSPWTLNTFSDCVTPPYQMIVTGTQATAITGYAIILMVADEATLMDIGVSALARGNGLGTALLKKVIQICTQRKMATIWLEVRAGNKVAINLYKNYGFTCEEVRKGYYQTAEKKEDAIIMKRILEANMI